MQNVESVSGAYVNGVLRARFSRKRNTMDANDALLTDGQQPFVIIAWGGSVGQGESLGYHGNVTRHVWNPPIQFTPCRK